MTTKEVLPKPATAPEELRKIDKEVLLKFYDMEWRDHFQTRRQTWKTLEIDALLVVGLLGINWQLGNFIATGIVSLLLVMTAFFGARITIYHREVEIDKLSNIKEIETKLGAAQMGLVGIGKERIPSPIIWYKVFHRKPSTLMFILVTHYMVIFFGITYLFFSVLNHFLHLI